jgi:CDP-diacylglycerol--serine O-phosphatidyltransferase
MKQIPNLFTLLNLILGCCAIVFLMQNGMTLVETEPSPQNPLGQTIQLLPQAVYMAPLFIGLAALVDFLDGFLARALGVSGEMGKQLDSLADVVSFGVAPSLIVYQFLRMAYAQTDTGLETSFCWLAPAFVLAAAAAWRLARFNLDAKPSHYFRGTPVPAVGLAVACFPLIYWHNSSPGVYALITAPWFWYALVALLSFLMVSSMPIIGNKPGKISPRALLPHGGVLLIAILSAIYLAWWAGPVTFAALVLFSLLFRKRIVQ